MKRWIWLLLLASGFTAQAQQNELKNDRGYSPNNYKHANKAAEARRWEENQRLTVAVPSYSSERIGNDVANYKRPGGRPYRNTGVVRFRHRMTDTTAPMLSQRNYKRYHRTLPPNKGFADKPDTSRQIDSGE
ncbi:MAG: hypothetical protein LH606_16185 [Cytophagaceae bacterium]|nr:hypothetical protein [Cytophagaceae bacterium]